jgi:hypothetical protein
MNLEPFSAIVFTIMFIFIIMGMVNKNIGRL